MLQGYVDDSKSEGEEKRLFLGGYIHRIEDWKSFSDDWAVALGAGRPLRALHMTRCFYGWSQDERHAKLLQLAAVIDRYKPLSIECSMSTRDFKEILQPHCPSVLRHPFGYVFQGLITKAGQLIKERGMKGPLEFVFDEQGNPGLDALAWYPIHKELNGLRDVLGGPPTFKNDEEVLPLQAADMLVWHCRILREANCTDKDREIADEIRSTHAVVDVPRETLHGWAKSFAAQPGIEDAKKIKKGVSRAHTDEIVRSVPPERLIPVMDAMLRHANRLIRLRNFLHRLGLRKVWKWVEKRKKTFR